MRVTSCVHCSELRIVVVTTGAGAALPLAAECPTEAGVAADCRCAAGGWKISSIWFQCEETAFVWGEAG